MTSELKPDLSSFGYADGGYMSKCRHCKETFLGAKRAWSCKPCAIKKSLEPKIEQPKPHVPELVRLHIDSEGVQVCKDGEYVLHSQAAEIIAAKDKEIYFDASLRITYKSLCETLNEDCGNRFKRTEAAETEIEKLKEQNDKFKWQVRDTCTRAEVAEAKLAQIKAQEPVAWQWQSSAGDWIDCDEFEAIRKVGIGKHNVRPLYAAPVSDSLKAENERLREYILAKRAYDAATKPNGGFGHQKKKNAKAQRPYRHSPN